MKIKLKEKQVCYIAHYIRGLNNETLLDVLMELKKQRGAAYQEDDNVEMEVSAAALVSIFGLLGDRQEKYAAGMNKRIGDSLLEQLKTLSEAPVGDAQKVEASVALKAINDLAVEYRATVDHWVKEGRAWLRGKR